MVSGKLVNTISYDHIIIHASKIQCLKNSTKYELNWPLEVIDISQRVYH